MSTRTKLFWVSVLYFAEGFPYGLITRFMPVCLAFFNVTNREIGYFLGIVSVAWTLKFLWSPLVDAWGRRKTWFLVCQIGLALVGVGLAMANFSFLGIAHWGLVIAASVLSATQDIAVDAYTIELLNPHEMGVGNGVRVTAYRVALIASSGLLLMVAGWLGWSYAFMTLAGLFVLIAMINIRAPIVSSLRPAEKPSDSVFHRSIVMPLKIFFSRPYFVVIMAFIVLFKIGDLALAPMTSPFWVKGKHFTAGDMGMVLGTVGIICNISGALVGGWLTTRWGIFRALWLLGLAQAVSNLAYVAASKMVPSMEVFTATASLEAFCGGLGTAPFLAFLMSICRKEHAATQYALLSALYGLSASIAATYSGILQDQLGYTRYFLLTFVLALPAFALLPWVRRSIQQTGTDNVNQAG